MTKEQMIEELTEYELHNITAVELISLFVSKYKEMLDTNFSTEELEQKYNMVFGDAEVVH